MIALSLLIALLMSCVHAPPLPESAPMTDRWVVYNQSYHLDTATASSTTYSTTGYVGGQAVTSSVTVTSSTSSSSTTLNAGSLLDSLEGPRCEGFAWVADCPAFREERR